MYEAAKTSRLALTRLDFACKGCEGNALSKFDFKKADPYKGKKLQDDTNVLTKFDFKKADPYKGKKLKDDVAPKLNGDADGVTLKKMPAEKNTLKDFKFSKWD